MKTIIFPLVLLVGIMFLASKTYDTGNGVVEKQTADSIRNDRKVFLHNDSGNAKEAYQNQAPELAKWFKMFEPQVAKFGATETFRGINWVRLNTGYLFPEITPDRTREHLALCKKEGRLPHPFACADFLDEFPEVQAGELWPNIQAGKTDEAVMADPTLSSWFNNPTFGRKIYLLPVSVANSDGTNPSTVPYNEMNVKARWRQTFIDIEFLPTVVLNSDYVNHPPTELDMTYILSVGASRDGMAPEFDAFYKNLPEMPNGAILVPFFMSGLPGFLSSFEGSTARISRGYAGARSIQIWQINHTVATTDFASLIVHEVGHVLGLRHPGDRALVPSFGGGPETGTSNVMNPSAGTYFSFTNYNIANALNVGNASQVEWMTSQVQTVPLTTVISLEKDGRVRLAFPYKNGGIWEVQSSLDCMTWNTISTSGNLPHAVSGASNFSGTHRLFFDPTTTIGSGQYFRVLEF